MGSSNLRASVQGTPQGPLRGTQEHAGLDVEALRLSFQGFGCKVYGSGLRFWYFQVEAFCFRQGSAFRGLVEMSTVWFVIEVLYLQVEASASTSRGCSTAQSLPSRAQSHPCARILLLAQYLPTRTLSILTVVPRTSTSKQRDCTHRGLLAQQSAKHRSQLQLRPAG